MNIRGLAAPNTAEGRAFEVGTDENTLWMRWLQQRVGNRQGKGNCYGPMNLDNRIAARYVFESRILIRFCRGSQKFAAQGWARDLSESGLGAFVAENLVLGELVTLQISLGISGKEVIAAKVSRQVGTQYGFRFTALSSEQRLGIQAALKGKAVIPYWHESS